MRKTIKIPRILKINWIDDLSVSVVFNNGESRIIDFRKVLKSIGVEAGSPAVILFDSKEFAKVTLDNHTLSWNNVSNTFPGKTEKRSRFRLSER